LIVPPLFQASIKYILIALCFLVALPCGSAVLDGGKQRQDRGRIEWQSNDRDEVAHGNFIGRADQGGQIPYPT
jgi:hypothetical protein